MDELADCVVEKLKEYGFEIYEHYLNDDGDDIIISEDFSVAVFQKTEEVAISFIVSVRPETAANTTLILNELVESNKVKRIEVLDSYIHMGGEEIYFGDEAFDAFNKVIEDNALRKFEEEMMMNDILRNADCYNC